MRVTKTSDGLSALQYRAGRPAGFPAGAPADHIASLVSPRSTRRDGQENQLVIRGRQHDDKTQAISPTAASRRQFQLTFVLADGMEVLGADLVSGLLIVRSRPSRAGRLVKSISHYGP